jgi:methanethiol S-methyltransferase
MAECVYDSISRGISRGAAHLAIHDKPLYISVETASGDPMTYVTIALLWTGYCALHSYLISVRFTRLMTRTLKEYYAFYRLFYVVLSFVLLVPLIAYTDRAEGADIISYGTILSIVRYALLSGAVLLFLWAFFMDYDALSFFGIRQLFGFRKTQDRGASEGIKNRGLLGIIRHPMYFSLIIYLWCTLFTAVDIIVTIILTVYIVIGTALEEKKLVLEFGDAYLAYQREVPMLIPFATAKGRRSAPPVPDRRN